MTKLHTCYVCNKQFFNATYWYDSLYDTKYDKRIIRPFCGPFCANKFRDMSDVNDYPQRKPLPRGEEWKIIQDINNVEYETD